MVDIENDIINAIIGIDSLNVLENNEEKVQEIRPYGRTLEGHTVPVDYRNLEDFEGSTHIMAHGEVDGKFYAWPTLFPGYENKETEETEAWRELETWEAFDEADNRGELFEFGSLEEAEKFAKGSWKL